MTGRDTFRTGMQYEETQSYQPWGLPLNEATLAQRFKAAGYSTHMVGMGSTYNIGCTVARLPFLALKCPFGLDCCVCSKLAI